MEYILETHNLGKRYKDFKAVSNLDMHIPKGAIYGLVGKNGAGKTTCIRLICGLQKPTTGTYSIYGTSNTNPQIVNVRKQLEELSGVRKGLREEISSYNTVLEAENRFSIDLLKLYVNAPVRVAEIKEQLNSKGLVATNIMIDQIEYYYCLTTLSSSDMTLMLLIPAGWI